MRSISLFIAVVTLAACQGGGAFSHLQTETFDPTKVTESTTRTFVLSNPSMDSEEHVRAIAFDTGSNAGGHFRIEKLRVGDQTVGTTDIVIPPGGALSVTVTYAPQNLKTTEADYAGWKTGDRDSDRWIPVAPEVAKKSKVPGAVVHRALIEAVYDHPEGGIIYVHLVGEAEPGPSGEKEAGGAFAKCVPGDGTACYSGGFALEIPQLAPGGPKPLEMTGPIRFSISQGAAKLRMDDFPYVIYYLRSEEIPQLPSGVTATLVISGAQGETAEGTFDGSRLTLADVTFRIRVALGELSVDQVKSGLSAMVDFNIPSIAITTIKPFQQGNITLHLETTLGANPSGNELFDQFLSGAKITAFLEGQLEM